MSEEWVADWAYVDWDAYLDKTVAKTGERYHVIVRIYKLKGVDDADELIINVRPESELYYKKVDPEPQTVTFELQVKNWYCGWKRPCDLPIIVELWAHFPERYRGRHKWLLDKKKLTLHLTSGEFPEARIDYVRVNYKLAENGKEVPVEKSPVKIEAYVKNIGGPGDIIVECLVDGVSYGQKTISTKSGKAEWDVDIAPGRHTVVVRAGHQEVSK